MTENERLSSEQEICPICGSGCEGPIAVNCDWRDDSYGECQKLLAAQDAKSIAARDKWWQDMVTLMMAGCRNKSCRVMTPDCEIGNNACMAWQSLKQSLEVKE
jgi:hypothetical protein